MGQKNKFNVGELVRIKEEGSWYHNKLCVIVARRKGRDGKRPWYEVSVKDRKDTIFFSEHQLIKMR